MSLSINCDRCKAQLSHVCKPELKTLLLKLFMWKPDSPLEGAIVDALKESDYYSEGGEGAPLFSGAFLYPLLGKEDARTVLATLHCLQDSIGLDRDALYEELCQLELDEDLVTLHREKRGRLVNQMYATKSPKDKKAFGDYLREIDEEAIEQAQRRLDMLERWEKPEELARKTVLSAVSEVASDDDFMHSIRGLSSENLSEKFKVFLKKHWSDPRP